MADAPQATGQLPLLQRNDSASTEPDEAQRLRQELERERKSSQEAKERYERLVERMALNDEPPAPAQTPAIDLSRPPDAMTDPEKWAQWFEAREQAQSRRMDERLTEVRQESLGDRLYAEFQSEHPEWAGAEAFDAVRAAFQQINGTKALPVDPSAQRDLKNRVAERCEENWRALEERRRKRESGDSEPEKSTTSATEDLSGGSHPRPRKPKGEEPPKNFVDQLSAAQAASGLY